MAPANVGRAVLYGIAAALPTSLVYGILVDPFGLGLGLIVVGLVGGWLIGNAMAYGAWQAREHAALPALRWTAAAIALIAWLVSTAISYLASQFFYQAATTPFLERVSLSGFIDYFQGSAIGPTLLGLAAMAFMAWRGAR